MSITIQSVNPYTFRHYHSMNLVFLKVKKLRSAEEHDTITNRDIDTS